MVCRWLIGWRGLQVGAKRSAWKELSRRRVCVVFQRPAQPTVAHRSPPPTLSLGLPFWAWRRFWCGLGSPGSPQTLPPGHAALGEGTTQTPSFSSAPRTQPLRRFVPYSHSHSAQSISPLTEAKPAPFLPYFQARTALVHSTFSTAIE